MTDIFQYVFTVAKLFKKISDVTEVTIDTDLLNAINVSEDTVVNQLL